MRTATRPGVEPAAPITVDTPRGDWTDAACIGYDLELWFRDTPTPNERRSQTAYRARKRDIARAKAICDSCPIQARCLEAHRRERYGIFGGTTPRERGFKEKKR